jgi:hypothetical protein
MALVLYIYEAISTLWDGAQELPDIYQMYVFIRRIRRYVTQRMKINR